MTTYIVRRRNKNNRIRGYTLVTEKNGTYYADAKVGGQYYGPLKYVLRGAVEYKSITMLASDNDLPENKSYNIVDVD